MGLSKALKPLDRFDDLTGGRRCLGLVGAAGRWAASSSRPAAYTSILTPCLAACLASSASSSGASSIVMVIDGLHLITLAPPFIGVNKHRVASEVVARWAAGSRSRRASRLIKRGRRIGALQRWRFSMHVPYVRRRLEEICLTACRVAITDLGAAVSSDDDETCLASDSQIAAELADAMRGSGRICPVAGYAP